MKKNFHLLMFAAFFAFLLSGCKPGYHVFSTISTPELTHKKEKKMDVYPGLDHIEAQFACSPKEHLGIISNTYFAYPGHTFGTFMSELGCGYYKGLNESSTKKGKWYFDIYGGFGGGARKYAGASNPGELAGSASINISSEYTKTFAQSSLYFKRNRSSLSFTLQGGWYYFTYFNSHYTYSNGFYSGLIRKFEDQSMFDIAGTITLKFQPFKKRNFYFITQIGRRMCFTEQVNSTDYSRFNPRALALNCGIHIPFNKAN